MINNWIKIAFRSYRKNLLFTAINILGLTLGMVGIILVTLYWNDELSYNQWNPNKEEVYSVAHRFNWSGKENYMAISTVPEGPAIKETFPEVEDFLVCSWLSRGIVKTENKSIFLENYLPVTPNFFDFFPFEFLHGSPTNALSDLQSIVISEDWMKQLYDGQNPVGKKLKINNKDYTVKGVYRIPGVSSVAPNAVVAMDWNKLLTENGTNWRTYQTGIYLKLKKGTDSKALAEKIQQEIVQKNAIEPFAKALNISVEDYITKNGDAKTELEQLSTMRLFGKAAGAGGAVKGNIVMLYILTALSILIMVLSAFNYINLTTASSVKRAKEVGIRKSLGASKVKLVFQFIVENLIICLFSLMLALALAEILLPYFNDYFEKNLQIKGLKIYFDLLLILIVTTMISGLVPALYLSNYHPLNVLKGNFSRSRHGIRIRNAMLGLQFLVSLLFLIAGIVIYLQVSFMAKKDLGFNGEQVVVVSLSGGDAFRKYNIIRQEFREIPGVTEVSGGFQTPAFANYVGGKAKSVKTDEELNLALSGAMDFDFVDMLNLKIIEGRNLSEKYASDTISNVLVNETLVKQLNLNEPIGEEIYYGSADKNFKIVGVVKDYFVFGFETDIDPVIYFHWNTVPWTKNQLNYVLLKIAPEQMSSTLNEIERKWKSEISPEGYPFDYHFIDKEFADTYKEYKNQQELFTVLTFVAITIALLGLFGLISFVIEQRMKEISIRKVLGASPKNLMKLIGKEYLIIAFASFVVCAPFTYYLLQKWLENFAYRIEIPIWPFVLALTFLLTLVLIIIGICVKYAMKVSPVKYLKYE